MLMRGNLPLCTIDRRTKIALRDARELAPKSAKEVYRRDCRHTLEWSALAARTLAVVEDSKKLVLRYAVSKDLFKALTSPEKPPYLVVDTAHFA